MGAFVDLTGQVFGRLTVIERAPTIVIEHAINIRKSYKTQWVCRCLCEPTRMVVVLTARLRSGHTTSCGCSRRSDLTDQEFGYLKAVRYLSSEHGNAVWLFACKCGNAIESKSKDVIDGRRKTCGCGRFFRNLMHGHANKNARSKPYRAWERTKKQRCGCRDAAWADFDTFLRDVGEEGFGRGLYLCRKDTSRPWGPDNFEWRATKQKRDTHAPF